MKKPNKKHAAAQSVKDANFRKHPARALAAAKFGSWLRAREVTRMKYRPRPVPAVNLDNLLAIEKMPTAMHGERFRP